MLWLPFLNKVINDLSVGLERHWAAYLGDSLGKVDKVNGGPNAATAGDASGGGPIWP